jgi:hypothetical protein
LTNDKGGMEEPDRLGTFRQQFFQFGVRSRDDVHRYQLTNAAGGRCASVGRSLHGADVSTDEHCDIASTDVFLADEYDVGGFHHRISGLDRTDQAFRFDHSQSFLGHKQRVVSVSALSLREPDGSSRSH